MDGRLEAVLEKQSYMLIGRHDVDNLMRRDPASAFMPTSLAHANVDSHIVDAETDGVELELNELLMKLRPIMQESLIRDNNKLILLASLSDSLEYIADSIERPLKNTQCIDHLLTIEFVKFYKFPTLLFTKSILTNYISLFFELATSNKMNEQFDSRIQILVQYIIDVIQDGHDV